LPTNQHRRNPSITQAARRLRKEQTPAERRLWSRLSRRQLNGLHFRRQHPVGRFIADFYCARHKLIIEVDGPVHDDQVEYDEIRSEWLESQGYHVMRFTNDEILRDLDGVVATIEAIIAELFATE